MIFVILLGLDSLEPTSVAVLLIVMLLIVIVVFLILSGAVKPSNVLVMKHSTDN